MGSKAVGLWGSALLGGGAAFRTWGLVEGGEVPGA